MRWTVAAPWFTVSRAFAHLGHAELAVRLLDGFQLRVAATLLRHGQLVRAEVVRAAADGVLAVAAARRSAGVISNTQPPFLSQTVRQNHVVRSSALSNFSASSTVVHSSSILRNRSSIGVPFKS